MRPSLLHLLLCSSLIAAGTGTPLVGVVIGSALLVASAPARAAEPDLDRLVAPHFPATQPGVAVLVLRDGQPLLRRGYGLASVELGVPIQPQQVFRIGSVTKQFTAALVLQQVEAGKLDLAAPIRSYLPALPAAWAKVTVAQCLNHTGGVPNYTASKGYRSGMGQDLKPAQILEAYCKDLPLDFEPGAHWQYSNTHYLLLGMLLEQVTGKPYDALLQERICVPLGLNHTRYGRETELIPGMVQGYQTGPVPAAQLSMSQPFAAGALVSNVDDLATWTLALHGGKVLKPASLALMTRPALTGDGQASHYGFGLTVQEDRGHTVFSHGGGVNGFVCDLSADPEQKTVVVVLCNSDAPGTSPSVLGKRLLDAACGRMVAPPTEVTLAVAALDALTGEYQLAPGFILKVCREGSKLQVQATGQPTLELHATSATRFFLTAVEASVEFQLGADGKAHSLHLLQGGRDMPAPRI